MAVTKIKPIKSTLSKALDYIENPDKTDGKMLVSSFGCSYETADIEFEYTLSQALQKPVYDAYRKARNREKYRAGQEQAIILHEAAVRSLKAAGIAKLPNLAALQSEYEALQAQKEALYADYGKLKKKVREYDIIKQNIDSILQADRQPEREKGTERG